MSNQTPDQPAGNFSSNNPYGHNPTQPQNHGQQHPTQHQEAYAPPPGPPPGRAGAFKESDFVPQAERGEQREAIQQFEISGSGHHDQADRDVAKLQEEYPNIDGSLIAALYGDAQSLSATREMLGELTSSNQGA